MGILLEVNQSQSAVHANHSVERLHKTSLHFLDQDIQSKSFFYSDSLTRDDVTALNQSASVQLTNNQSKMMYNRTLLIELNNEIVVTLIPAILYLAVLMLVGSVGNCLTIYIFGWKLKRTTQNCLFMWLGVFDLMSCVIGMPSEIVDIARYYLYEDVAACKVLRFLLSLTPVASANLLVIIAVDRYRRVCKPLHSQMELVHARIGVGVAAGFAVVLAGPAFSLYGKRTVKTSVEGLHGCDCSLQDKFQGRLYPLLYELMFGVFFLIYTTVLSFMYARVWLETRRHRRYMASHSIPTVAISALLTSEGDDSSSAVDTPQNSRKNSGILTLEISKKIRKSLKAKKLTVIAFAVTVVFVLSYLPHLVLIIIRTVCADFDHQLEGAGLIFYNIFLRSYFVNSVANVFVYSAMNADFKQHCKMLCAAWRKQDREERPPDEETPV